MKITNKKRNIIQNKIISIIIVFTLVFSFINCIKPDTNTFAKSINNYCCDYYESNEPAEVCENIREIFSKYNIDNEDNLLMVGCNKDYILDASLVGNAIGVVRDLAFGEYYICYGNEEDLKYAKTLLESNPNIEYAEKNEKIQLKDDFISNEDNAKLSTNEVETLDINDDWGVKIIKIKEYVSQLESDVKDREVKIGVIDTGIYEDHELFQGKIEGGYDFANSDDDPRDITGHGTHVAGIISNALQELNYKIVPYKVFKLETIIENGEEKMIAMADTKDICLGVKRAISDGCSVINMSLTVIAGPFEKCEEREAGKSLHNAIRGALNHKICVVTAAGNEGIDAKNNCPAHMGYKDDDKNCNIITVGAICIETYDDIREIKKLDISNYGQTVDVYAPGLFITSAGLPPDNYSIKSGTSMAAPFISAMAAVYKVENPDLTCEDIENIIKNNAIDFKYAVDNDKNTKVEMDGKFATFEKLLNKEPEPEPEPKLSPVYRLWNKKTGEHYYTTNENEKRGLIDAGWEDERIRWYSPTEKKEAEKIEGAVGVYKLYNKNSGKYLFTAKVGEVSKLEKIGWEVKNGGEPVFYSCGGIEIYRLYNPNDGDHLLTTSWNEREKLRKLGWIPEDNASLKTLKKE